MSNSASALSSTNQSANQKSACTSALRMTSNRTSNLCPVLLHHHHQQGRSITAVKSVSLGDIIYGSGTIIVYCFTSVVIFLSCLSFLEFLSSCVVFLGGGQSTEEPLSFNS